jgi:outer membrane receptor protein involved in Fe transport
VPRAFGAFSVLLKRIAIIATICLATCFRLSAQEALQQSKAPEDMTLEELVNVRVDEVASLGSSEERKVPAAVTIITAEDIKESGAHNIDELLEIYVPDALYLRHNWDEDHVGIRGLISDTENQYLLLVNGKVMNNYAVAGAISERDLVMFGDIKEIRVISGPGSAVYGAGALSGVIDIQTFDGNSFKGSEVTGTVGGIDEFYSGEVKTTLDFREGANLFLYGGISDLKGAQPSDAPYIMGISGLAPGGAPVTAGQPYPLPLGRDGRQYYDVPPLKLYAELNVDNFSLWARFTRGGETQPFEQRWLIQPPAGLTGLPPFATYQPHGVGYQQLSLGSDYKYEISDNWEIDTRLGASTDDYVRTEFDGLLDASREDIYDARVLAVWKSAPTHSLTFGFEGMHGEYGLPTIGYPGGPALSVAWAGVSPTPNGVSGFMPRWSSDTFSFLAEDVWDIASEWRLFTDFRVDKNYDTDYMLSPRAALIYSPSKDDTFKLILSQATKADIAEELELQYELNGSTDDTETLRSAELDYNRLVGEHISLGANTFFYDAHVIGWDNNANRTEPVGDEDIAGFELMADYRTRVFQLSLSHAFSKLVDFRNSVGGIEGQAITSQPYGFGNDLNHWSTQVSKVRFTYRPIDKLRFTGSLRVFWGWPGFKDYTDYANSVGVDSTGTPLEFLRDPTYNPYSQIQARLNLGLIYDITSKVTASIHGDNLLGLANGNLNNRFIIFSSSAQQDPVSVIGSLSVKF